jgi:hypothetical protein
MLGRTDEVTKEVLETITSVLAYPTVYLYWPINKPSGCSSSTVRHGGYQQPASSATNCTALTQKCHLASHTQGAEKKNQEPSCLAELNTAHLLHCHTETDTSGKLMNRQTFYKRAVCYFAYLISLTAESPHSYLPSLCLTLHYLGIQRISFLFSFCLDKLIKCP